LSLAESVVLHPRSHRNLPPKRGFCAHFAPNFASRAAASTEVVAMPYRDEEKKKEWEKRHRPQRIARRRQLRQIEAAWKEAHPEAVGYKGNVAAILAPVVAGGTLAAWSPPLAIGAGGLTVLVAALYKKSWIWWLGHRYLGRGPVLRME